MKQALLQMDIDCLQYLADHGGSAPTVAIPAKIFNGEIPTGIPNLIDLGLIEHIAEITKITADGSRLLWDHLDDPQTVR